MDEAIGRAAGDAPALSKGGESNSCHSSMSADMDCRRIGSQELEGLWKRTEAFAYIRIEPG